MSRFGRGKYGCPYCGFCNPPGQVDDHEAMDRLPVGTFAQMTKPCPRCYGTGIFVSRAAAGLADL